jgi:hypothetical protein
VPLKFKIKKFNTIAIRSSSPPALTIINIIPKWITTKHISLHFYSIQLSARRTSLSVLILYYRTWSQIQQTIHALKIKHNRRNVRRLPLIFSTRIIGYTGLSLSVSSDWVRWFEYQSYSTLGSTFLRVGA